MSITESVTHHINSALDEAEDTVRVPDFTITLEGKDDSLKNVTQRIMSLTMTDNRGFEADRVTLEIDDADGEVVLPERGTRLSLSLGWKGESLTHKGTFVVDEVAHDGPPDKLTISANSADFREEFNVKREVSWHDVTVERVVSAIANRYGLKAQISEMLMNIEIDHADQTEESDMSFLTRMADMLGAIATVKNGCLLFILPGGGVTASGRALPSFALTRSDGDSHRFRIADRQAYTGVKAYWLDLKFGQKKAVNVKKRNAQTTQKPEKSSSREGGYMEGAEGNVYVLRRTYPNEEAARRAAAARWQQLQRGAAEFSITLARGRADLYPEMHGTVSGFKSVVAH
ncbi:contractile injection system protein, VgrG/Pvc8 family [Escherichia coli]|uniref:contractile injection system protein, VgrG/Pvc8 family n=1 Tax=Escherichia coli TaxID=562 RepID=UPI00208DB133|nr:contractile injection system protein, VgrG/Pvc8 family [Escherichia coli]